MPIDRFGVSKKSKKPWEQDYGDDWDKQRERCLRRDGYRCRSCGCSVKGTSKRAVHHVVELSAGGSNSLSNLKTQCEPCHIKEHPHLQERERKKKIKTVFQPIKKSVFSKSPSKKSVRSYHAKNRSLW